MNNAKIKRRAFITLLGGAAAAWPVAARAQQPAMPAIGYLSIGLPEPEKVRIVGFLQGLNEAGYVEHRNVAIEYRWANGQFDRLPALAAGLVRRQVALIATPGSTAAAIAAKAASMTIPIVFSIGSDPVEDGLVASLNRPGGRATGVSSINSTIVAKLFEMLCDAVPKAEMIGLLVNPSGPLATFYTKAVQAAANALGRSIRIAKASGESDFDGAFTALVQQRVGALVIPSDGLFNNRPNQLVALSVRHAIPTMLPLREYVTAGGLISYGARQIDLYRQVGVYAGRILKGEKPADLPVQQPTKYELVLNLKTAKALGLTVPDRLLVAADEVIE